MSLAESDDQWCRAFGATISTDDIDSLPDLLTVQTGWALVSIAIPKLRLRRGVAARRLVWIIVHWIKRDNGNVHRAAAKILQAEKAARPAAPCATYCYPASEVRVFLSNVRADA